MKIYPQNSRNIIYTRFHQLSHISSAPVGVENEHHKPRKLFWCTNTLRKQYRQARKVRANSILPPLYSLDCVKIWITNQEMIVTVLKCGLFSQTDIPLGFPGLLLAPRNFGLTILTPFSLKLIVESDNKHLVSIAFADRGATRSFDSCICCQLLQQTVRKLLSKLVF